VCPDGYRGFESHSLRYWIGAGAGRREAHDPTWVARGFLALRARTLGAARFGLAAHSAACFIARQTVRIPLSPLLVGTRAPRLSRGTRRKLCRPWVLRSPSARSDLRGGKVRPGSAQRDLFRPYCGVPRHGTPPDNDRERRSHGIEGPRRPEASPCWGLGLARTVPQVRQAL